LTPVKDQSSRRILGCSLLRTGGEEPLEAVARILRRSGVKIGKVDRRINLISGRIGSIFDRHSCKVKARVFSQRDVSLIELVCETAWRRPGTLALVGYVEVLRSNFDNISLAQTEQTMQWEQTVKEGKKAKRIRTEAVNLLNSMEAEMG